MCKSGDIVYFISAGIVLMPAFVWFAYGMGSFLNMIMKPKNKKRKQV